MTLRCLLGHDWSKDCERCARCGGTRTGAHDWDKDGKECAKCGKRLQALIDVLIDILVHSPSSVNGSDPQVEAVGQLVHIGLPAVEPLCRLISSGRANSVYARTWAVCALGQIGHESCLGPLINALEDGDQGIATNAIFGLATIGKAAVEHLGSAVTAAIVDRGAHRGDGDFKAYLLAGYGGHALRDIETGVPQPPAHVIILHGVLMGSYRHGRRLPPRDFP